MMKKTKDKCPTCNGFGYTSPFHKGRYCRTCCKSFFIEQDDIQTAKTENNILMDSVAYKALADDTKRQVNNMKLAALDERKRIMKLFDEFPCFTCEECIEDFKEEVNKIKLEIK